MNADAGEPVDLKQFLRILNRQKWVILFFLAVSQILVAVKFARTTDRYVAESKYIFKTAPTETPFSNIAAIMGIRPSAQANSNMSAFFEIILYTDEFLDPILKRKWTVDGESVTLAQVWKMNAADTSYRSFRAQVGQLLHRECIQVKKDVRSGLVTMETRFEKPELALDVNMFIINQLNDYILNQTKSQASENRKFIEKRLVEVAAELRNSEDLLLGFNLRNKSIASPELLLQSLRFKRAVEINQEVYLQLKKELEIAKITERKESPVIEVLSKPKFPLGPESRLGAKHYLVVTVGGIFLGLFVGLLAYFLIPARKPARSSH